MKKVINVLFISVFILFIGCAKDGATGPQGPTGPSGTANISSSIYTATPGSWNGTGPWYYIDLSVSAITNGNQDLVMVYVQDISGAWNGMPASSIFVGGDIFQFSFSTGALTLWYNNTSAPAATWAFRIVVIPPAMKKKDVDYTSYSVVKTAYNLND